MSSAVWSKLLAKYDIDDALRAHAYEASSATKRACLKNAIAFHALEDEGPSHTHIQREYAAKGYLLNKQISPAPWVLCICAPDYNSPARFIAALMPALMAQVPQIYVLHMGKPAPSLLVALELLGIEQALAIAEKSLNEVQELLTDLSTEQGRVLLFSDGKLDMASVHNHANSLHIPLWEDAGPPHIYAHPNADQDLLNFADPHAVFCELSSPHLDAVYGYDKSNPSPKASQIWGKGMEGCFIHLHLSKAFFQNSTLMAESLIHNEGD